MPKSQGEKIVDDWFSRHHENSFFSFLWTLNDTEASVVHDFLLRKGNVSGSSGQFSDITPDSDNVGQTDGCVESAKKSKSSNVDDIVETPNKQETPNHEWKEVVKHLNQRRKMELIVVQKSDRWEQKQKSLCWNVQKEEPPFFKGRWYGCKLSSSKRHTLEL